MTILSTAYFPNIQYFTEVLRASELIIEQYENFPKQTYRNRCHILAANGVLPLVVPVLNGRSGKIKTKDIKISFVENWQKQHYQSIKSAYSSAPFYDYIMPEFEFLFTKKFHFLIELNNSILKTIKKLLEIKTDFSLTEDFIEINEQNKSDFRFTISPKIKIDLNSEKYIQVFSDRFEFQPNLSILDLLFNLGPESRIFLINN
ncbi:MAG: WbqC family protein [Bacteroidales bacterium]|nr:WbqC family protein [Bacteroidales bacterium]